MLAAMKIYWYGFILWLVPFASAFFMYDQNGQLVVDIFLFKTAILLVSTITGCLLASKYLLNSSSNYFKTSISMGIIWVITSWVLDFLILLPISDMDLADYFIQIGFRYLIIPMYCVSMGYMLSEKLAKKS